METGEARLAVADTLAALNAALRRDAGPGLWFKETSARNLRSRDFLAPRGALRTLFPGGQVGGGAWAKGRGLRSPARAQRGTRAGPGLTALSPQVPGAAVEAVQALRGAAVPPVRSCQQGVAGLAVQLHRTAVFRHVLASADTYARPPPPAATVSPRVVLHCAALQRRRPAPLGLAQLRAVLLTDHLAAVLRACGSVGRCPAWGGAQAWPPCSRIGLAGRTCAWSRLPLRTASASSWASWGWTGPGRPKRRPPRRLWQPGNERSASARTPRRGSRAQGPTGRCLWCA